jgi:hypothetical protein
MTQQSRNLATTAIVVFPSRDAEIVRNVGPTFTLLLGTTPPSKPSVLPSTQTKSTGGTYDRVNNTLCALKAILLTNTELILFAYAEFLPQPNTFPFKGMLEH